ncbi:MAG: OmpH family outer membrane protein [Bacteroidales bacterium]|nr:OmpH family outer membrane protein [Bacteroidales bacterium]
MKNLSPIAKLSIAINAVLIIAIAVFLYLQFGSAEKPAERPVEKTVEATSSMQIAYVNIDSLLLNYKLSEELNQEFTRKQEKIKADLQRKADKFQKEAAEFQDKVKRGGFLTQQRAEEEQQKLIDKQQKLQILQNDLGNKLLADQQEMNKQLYNKITSFIAEYNETHKYKFILSNTTGGTLLYGDEDCNITNEVLYGLNSKYDEDHK